MAEPRVVYVVLCGDAACLYVVGVFSTSDQARSTIEDHRTTMFVTDCELVRIVVDDPESMEHLPLAPDGSLS